jgi:hypothetical protein
MWEIKQFKTRQAMNAWLERNGDSCQWVEVVINNAYGLQFRKLRVVG